MLSENAVLFVKYFFQHNYMFSYLFMCHTPDITNRWSMTSMSNRCPKICGLSITHRWHRLLIDVIDCSWWPIDYSSTIMRRIKDTFPAFFDQKYHLYGLHWTFVLPERTLYELWTCLMQIEMSQADRTNKTHIGTEVSKSNGNLSRYMTSVHLLRAQSCC